jgi:hypothetical protein
MAGSRYPRSGHRLAPATLRELLSVPVPAKYLTKKEDADLLLCDLDETAWERFGEEVCQQLAVEVIQAVGRAIRTPVPLKQRRLPAIPDRLTLADLDLEIRTLKCLMSAGIHERPQDLQRMTIGGVLAIRGFWAKSLVDLLSSLEYVIDHPEARRALPAATNATKASLWRPLVAGYGIRTYPPLVRPWSKRWPSGARAASAVALQHLQAAHGWPRPHHRLAPQTLKEVLLDPIPSRLLRGTRFRGARLCDLDESTWKHFTPARINRLAGLILSRVGAAAHHPVILERRLPRPSPGMRLEDLRLENRTHHCLQRAGLARHPEALGRLTVGDLLSIRGFGSKCLLDLLSSLEARVPRRRKLDKKLTAEAQALANLSEAQQIQFTDPRLGGLLRAIDTESNTVGELARRLLRRRRDPPDPLHVRRQIAELRDTIRRLSDLPLEAELLQLFAPASCARDRRILAAYYGWDGRGGRTLEELGRKHGLSRERIRQICARAVRQNRGTAAFAPVLDRALRLLGKRLPRALDELQAEFDAAHISACRLPVEAVQQAAEYLSRRPDLAVIHVAQTHLVVRPKQAKMLRAVVETARQLVSNYGIAKHADLTAALAGRTPEKLRPALIRETLQTQHDLRWLDQSRNWFRLEPLPHYGLPHMIDKVLSVAGRIDVSALHAAVARYRRTSRQPPPREILREFCRQMPGTRVQRNLVISDRARDWRKVLTGVERCMVEVLHEHGPVMERTAFEELCIRKGTNRFSFNAILMSSPVVAQYGRGLYGLPGLKLSRKTVRELASRKPPAAPKRVLRAFGRTAEGKLYLAYRLSRAAISGGVVTVPSAMKRHVRGKFNLRTDQGHDVGTLVARHGCGWGLGPALRRGHAQQGDHMLLVFDPPQRQARIHIGDEKLLQRVTSTKE